MYAMFVGTMAVIFILAAAWAQTRRLDIGERRRQRTRARHHIDCGGFDVAGRQTVACSAARASPLDRRRGEWPHGSGDCHLLVACPAAIASR